MGGRQFCLLRGFKERRGKDITLLPGGVLPQKSALNEEKVNFVILASTSAEFHAELKNHFLLRYRGF